MTTYNKSAVYQHMHNGHYVQAGVMHIEAARVRQHEVTERRYAQGAIMPTFYLLLELILMLLLIYTVSQIHVAWLTIVAIGGALYFLASSSLPRYQAVLLRQKRVEAQRAASSNC